MNKEERLVRIAATLADEEGYAAGVGERGDFGRAKLIWAALGEVKSAVAKMADVPDEAYAGALADELSRRRDDYVRSWDDEDGNGTSTFRRIQRLLEIEGE